METIRYTPKGVCSRSMEIDVEGGVIQAVRVEGGCHGNLQGIAALVKDMPAEEVIRRLKDIHCKTKGTSCPDQLARGLEQALSQR